MVHILVGSLQHHSHSYYVCLDLDRSNTIVSFKVVCEFSCATVDTFNVCFPLSW